MQPAIRPIILRRGKTFVLSFTLQTRTKNPTTGVVTVTPWNLTGYSAEFKFAADYGLANLISATTGNGKIALGGTNGVITVTIPPSDINALSATIERGVYELNITSGGGTVYPVFEGDARVAKAVS